jgi:hypothetical protein
MSPLFPADLLRDKLAKFSLRRFADLAAKQVALAEWLAQLPTKLSKQKEEAVKSRFITDFFEQVLGYNSHRAVEWQLEEEYRTKVDATKPDAVLGYFTVERTTDICRAVIELKGAATGLDQSQVCRKQPKTAVDQAFEYVSKMGPECRWVIASNLREIRFYYHDDRTRCQQYRLDELGQEDRLKELLFLFHKDQFLVRQGQSKTEKLLALTRQAGLPVRTAARHIVAELEECRLQFAGLHFVDPHYLAALPPFNILGQHVWHYQRGTLLTLNPALCHLLEHLQVEQGQLHISEALARELEAAGIGDATQRLTAIFQFLNHCHITRLVAVRDHAALTQRRSTNALGFSERHWFQLAEADGVDKEIYLLQHGQCPCPQCRFRRLDLPDFLGWLRSNSAQTATERLTQAYGHYLAGTNHFKEAYEQYGQVEQQAAARQEKDIFYFLARYNRLRLHNLLVGYYPHADAEQLLADLREIDLVTVVTDELEATLSRPARDYLLEILDDKLLRRTEHQAQDTTEKLRPRRRWLRQGRPFNAPDYLADLAEEYGLLYQHLNRNFLVGDVFRDYRTLARRTLRAVLLDYHPRWGGRNLLAQFFLDEAVFSLDPDELAALLAKYHYLETEPATRQALLTKFSSLLQSCYQRGLFSDPYPNALVEEFLHGHYFRDKLTNVFSNLVLVLARLRLLPDELAAVAVHLPAFLQVETMLAPHDVKHLANFVSRRGQLLGEACLTQLLELAMREYRGGRLRYHELIVPLAGVLHAHFPAYRLTSLELLRKAVAACDLAGERRTGLQQLASLTKLTAETGATYLRQQFEAQLIEEFDADFYEHLLRLGALTYSAAPGYFSQLVAHVNQTKRGSSPEIRSGRLDYRDYGFYNFALLVYDKQLGFQLPELAQFTNLSDFECWLLNPIDFAYARFNPDWLRVLAHQQFFDILRTIRPLVRALQIRLAEAYNPELYRLYFRHFVPASSQNTLPDSSVKASNDR